MAITVPVTADFARTTLLDRHLAPRLSRPLLIAVVAASALGGFWATGDASAARAVAAAGPELTQLLRAMAALKMLFAAAVSGAVVWRLVAPIGWLRLAAYGLACACVAAGPGLIWDMTHVRLGALLLHGGLLAGVVMLWRDPATTTLLRQAIARRRAKLATGT